MTTPNDPFAAPAPGSTPPAPPAPPPYGAPPPPPYGAPYAAPYGAPLPQPRNGMGVASLVLGIASILVVPFLLVPAVLAVVLGVLGRKRARRGEATNGGVALAGIITGAFGIVFFGAIVALVVVLFTSQAGQDFLDCLDAAGNSSTAQDACSQKLADDLLGR